ncbi:MAG: TfoX/Sxy family protein [Gemmatimonadaceae bacterium]
MAREVIDGVDESLAARIRVQLGKRKGLAEKKTFGGIGFLLNGNIACAVRRDEMLVRVAPEKTDEALAQKHTRMFDLSGTRPMKGWILVEQEGLKTDKSLAKWVETGVDYAASLPSK